MAVNPISLKRYRLAMLQVDNLFRMRSQITQTHLLIRSI